MDSMIYNPQEEFDGKLKNLHADNTQKFFDVLVAKSGVNPDENRKTVKEYEDTLECVAKLKKKLNWRKFFRVLFIITIILIPLAIFVTTKKIKKLKKEIEETQKKADSLLAEAKRQMAALNGLFTDKDALKIIESTIPLISFADCFSVEQETNMVTNFDFGDRNNIEQSTLDVLAGHYNENPFLFENRLIHKMGTQVYHGYKTIRWTERYRSSDGKMHTRTRTQTLHATLTKPKPFYSTQVVLNYCAQGGPELSFSRDATNLDEKNERQIERYLKRGEKKLKKKTDEAIKNNSDFVSMSNSDFEILFDALDRTNEVQYRTLFTPLAQTNIVDLILSKTGYGDDFNFIKQNRTNRIITEHSQGRNINLLPTEYISYSFDIIKENFQKKNADFFSAVYFDFAPLWAIPMYQERPVHSLKPLPKYSQLYSYKECEALSNAVNRKELVHPHTKTEAILKSAYVKPCNSGDEICVTAYSYDIICRVDFVPMMGGDGRLHQVPVNWDEYIPLSKDTSLFVSESEKAKGDILATRKNLSILK